jgi:8-oxo-dGTP pyrophosphatase MutT (NUDIX family)
MINKVNINNPIGNLYRKEHSLILVKQADKYILGLKQHFYPRGFARMIGGGINLGETPLEAAKREVFEELSYVVANEIEFVASIKTIAETAQGEMIMNTHIFYLEIESDTELVVGDDVTGLQYLTDKEFQKLIFSMSQLQGTYNEKEGLFNFDWKDYGVIYEPIHQIAYDFAKTK